MSKFIVQKNENAKILALLGVLAIYLLLVMGYLNTCLKILFYYIGE